MQPERSWRGAARDAAPIALALALCPLVAALAPGPTRPLLRVRELIGAERSLGLFFEPAVYGWVAARPHLLRAADLAYVSVHLPVTLGVLAWAWRARPRAFPVVRDAFVGAQLLTVLGYVLLPTAPPRMVAGLGYGGALSAGEQGLARLFQSPYAAMPSGHVAFALIAAGTMATLARSRPVRVVAVLYPVAVVGEIVVTGNHLWLDAAGGAVAAALGFGLARCLSATRARTSMPRGQLIGFEGARRADR